MCWNDPEECPNCGRINAVGIMSLAKTCECGFYLVDIREGRGWYTSRDAYENGEAPVKALL
jgi:hypothetical protein